MTTSADSCRWYVESAAKIYRQPSTSSPADGMAYPRQEVQVSRYSYNGRVYFVQNRTTGVNGWVEKRHIESARVRRAPKAGSR